MFSTSSHRLDGDRHRSRCECIQCTLQKFYTLVISTCEYRATLFYHDSVEAASWPNYFAELPPRRIACWAPGAVATGAVAGEGLTTPAALPARPPHLHLKPRREVRRRVVGVRPLPQQFIPPVLAAPHREVVGGRHCARPAQAGHPVR
jgi:hypothetical protein